MRLIGFDVDDMFLNSKVKNDYTFFYHLGDKVCSLPNFMYFNIDTSRLASEGVVYLEKNIFLLGTSKDKGCFEVHHDKIKTRGMLFFGMSPVSLDAVYPNVHVHAFLKNKRSLVQTKICAIGFDKDFNKLKYVLYVPNEVYVKDNYILYDTKGNISDVDTDRMLQLNFKELLELSIKK